MSSTIVGAASAAMSELAVRTWLAEVGWADITARGMDPGHVHVDGRRCPVVAWMYDGAVVVALARDPASGEWILVQ